MGYLRDIRRLTVALSRARLGLYILGRRDVFEACYELRQAFELLLQRPDKLALVTGELWPSTRMLADEEGGSVSDAATATGEAVMEGVEHLGQYVFEMTKTKVSQLRAEKGLLQDGGGDDVALIGAPGPQPGEEEDGEGAALPAEKEAMEVVAEEAGEPGDDDDEEEAVVEGFEAEED